ncbi:MAG: response regulator transcription factor [Anaerolineae bacterium]|jgi:NarL family two-component system response regulator LiaR
MVVDDHAVVRGGIEYSLLALDDIEFVGSAASGSEALRLCDEVQPDVVLMDMVMPGMDGVATTRALLERLPRVRVIALTSFQEGRLVQDALQAGATSYLLKDVELDDLQNAIRAAYDGRSILAPEAAKALAQATAEPQKIGQDLTDRERQVLALVVSGLSNAEIAGRLEVSLSTARFHLSSILSKLEAANRAEAAAIAVKNRLI